MSTKRKSTELFESKPRWPGAPKICLAANLPAFPSLEALDAFHKANGPSCKVIGTWQCDFCGQFHAETVAPDPAGNSSGTGRSSKVDYDEKAVQRRFRKAAFGENYV